MSHRNNQHSFMFCYKWILQKTTVVISKLTFFLHDKFQILTIALPRIQFSWDAMLCCWVCKTPKCWRVTGPTSFRPLLECLTLNKTTIPSCHMVASACPSTQSRIRIISPLLNLYFSFPSHMAWKLQNQLSYLFPISAPSFIILCVSYTNDTYLVFLLKALNSSQATAQVSGWCFWFLFCYPLKLVIYIPQELMQQKCILQIVPSNLHWLLQGVVPVGQNTMQSRLASVWYLSDRTQCSHS